VRDSASLVTTEAVVGLSVAQRVKWARGQAGLSQKALARQIGTSRRHVIRWEKGQHKPNPTFAARIAKATGTTIDLFQDEAA
jgi:transcriptional regulator with XRE-family HTH domain